ncbi:MAG: hypothetical protein RLZZ352_1169 [Pseudomonadota bacterium]|jgi:hypothetical protein
MSDSKPTGFGQFVPGFDFLQNLAGLAASGMAQGLGQGLGQGLPQTPSLGHWVAPTFNVEDLEKRIQELKAVQFWLEQNNKALGATIQALEVQKMTLVTLKNMNISFGDVANTLKVKTAEALASFTGGTPAAEAAPAAASTPFAGLEIPPRTYGNPAATPPSTATTAVPETPAGGASAEATGNPAGVVDPMQWWGALTQQFQQIASSTLQDMARQNPLEGTREAATGLTEQAVKAATDLAGQVTQGLSDTVARQVEMANSMAANLGQAAQVVTEPVKPARKSKTTAPKTASKASSKQAETQADSAPAMARKTPASTTAKTTAKAPAATTAAAKKQTPRTR